MKPLIQPLTNKELAQGWVDLPLSYDGIKAAIVAAASGPFDQPASVRLIRPPSRTAWNLFWAWQRTDGNPLVLIGGCLPEHPMQNPPGWVASLDTHSFNRLCEAAVELTFGRVVTQRILRVIECQGTGQPYPKAPGRELTEAELAAGAADVELTWHHLPREGFPATVRLLRPTPDALRRVLAGMAGRPLHLLAFIPPCLHADWPEDFLDDLSIDCLQQLSAASFELCLGRQALQELDAKIGAALTPRPQPQDPKP